MGLDLKITPYKAKTLYAEYKDIIDKKKNVIEFILKADLLQLTKEYNSLSLQEVLKSSLDIFSKISIFYNNSNQFIQNYLDGIGTVADCDDLCRDSGKLTMQNEILKQSFSNSYVMNYIYYSIVNNRSMKEKYLSEEMRNELAMTIRLMKSDNADQIVTILQGKLSEIESIVKTLSNSDVTIGLNEVVNKADVVKEDLLLHKDMQEAVSDKINLMSKNIDVNLDNMKEALNDIELANVQNVYNVDTLLNRVDSSLLSLQIKTKEIEHSIKSNDRNSGVEEKLINSKIESLIEIIGGLKSLYENDVDVGLMIENINTLESLLANTKDSVNNQIISTKEIDAKVKSIVSGTKIIKGALDSLNTIMRTDLIDSLIKGNTSVLQIDKDVTSISNKYSQIKGGN